MRFLALAAAVLAALTFIFGVKVTVLGLSFAVLVMIPVYAVWQMERRELTHRERMTRKGDQS